MGLGKTMEFSTVQCNPIKKSLAKQRVPGSIVEVVERFFKKILKFFNPHAFIIKVFLLLL